MRVLVTGGSGFIGTNLVEHFLSRDVPVANLDWNPPLNPGHRALWKPADIMDQSAVRAVIRDFQPTHVVHLAARTDTDELDDIAAYAQNHEGTQLLLDVVKESPTIERVVITSTQFVCEAGYQPANDIDFKPFTVYGESKRRTEMATRTAGLTCAWTIIRPTTIWGPWNLRYRDGMFRVMTNGLYFHPSKANVIRSYGYVGNVVWQIDRILGSPREEVDGKVFYVGDRPFDLKLWVDGVSRELTGHPARIIPTSLIHLLAVFGDTLARMRLRFPLTSGRFKSMTSDYITPMDKTIAALGGESPFSMQQGIRDTVKWYRDGSDRIVAPSRKDVRQGRAGAE